MIAQSTLGSAVYCSCDYYAGVLPGAFQVEASRGIRPSVIMRPFIMLETSPSLSMLDLGEAQRATTMPSPWTSANTVKHRQRSANLGQKWRKLAELG